MLADLVLIRHRTSKARVARPIIRVADIFNRYEVDTERVDTTANRDHASQG